MIALLRAGALAANVVLLGGLPLLCGLAWPWAVASVFVFFGLSWWACGRAPAGDDASPEVCEEAASIARRLGAPPPRFVRTLPGWTAAVVRAGRGGYGVLIGAEVARGHSGAVFAHEMAHFATGDVAWEPFTDGPARLLLGAAGRVPPLVLAAVPFLVLAAPLARATELRADRLAAAVVPSYAATLAEVTDRMGRAETFLYPSLSTRVRSARNVSG